MFIPNERTDRTISAMEEYESRSLDEAFDQNSLGSTGQDRRKNGSLLSGLQNARPLRDLALPSIRPAGASSAGRSECRAPAFAGARIGGEGGIRTPGTLASTSVFETDPFDHSGTSPNGRQI